MPQQQQSPIQVENSFIGGLKTEFTGLNFPENACTSTENCVFSLIGDVFRRDGIDFETNFTTASINKTNSAISTFVWTNAGGDGVSKILVEQVGSTLYFYLQSSATTTVPLSGTKIASTIDLTAFTATDGTFDPTIECQYSSGNGYLFIYHPSMDPIYCTYALGVVSANVIIIKQRDFVGIVEPGVDDNFRPFTLSNEHQYNIQNQGWTSAALWQGNTSTMFVPPTVVLGSNTFTIQTGLTIVNGTNVNIIAVASGGGNGAGGSGTVTSYNSGTGVLIINATSTNSSHTNGTWQITPTNVGLITAWHTAEGNYPSNSDVWWTFKNSSGVFDPATTAANVTLGSGPAPKGFYIINAFDQERSIVSGLSNITPVTTTTRPKTGAFFQGRVWYSGVDASFPPTGDEPFSTWTENLYFSQIITSTAQFGRCYQTNDPTSETLATELPTDGGVITIPGCGSIYKLFAIQNGLLVFAANGIWYITGSSGIGFTAIDYIVQKISGIRTISSTSFIDVNGLPFFWNEEGIYEIVPATSKSGIKSNEQVSLQAEPVTLGTILSFYNSIPLQSKKYARGDYNPITYVIKWLYRSTNETDITSRYQYDSVLNLNLANKAFYPYQIAGTPTINSINYITSAGGTGSPITTFKYLCSYPSSGSFNFTFAEENNTNFLDWQAFDGIGTNYNSFFITGYRIAGQAMMRFQPLYIKMYSRNLTPSIKYTVQAIWNYANTPNTGRWSTQQIIQNSGNRYDNTVRRIKLRGHGEVLQIKVASVQGQPFDLIGWAVINDVDLGI